MAFFNQQQQPSSGGYGGYGGGVGGGDNLQFYGSSPQQAQQQHPQGQSPLGAGAMYSGYDNMGMNMGSMGMGNLGGMGMGAGAASGNMSSQRQSLSDGRWWEAFGTCGFEGELGLMEELGVNPSHILAKTLTVLNPFSRVDAHIMDDADLAGPLVFCFAFALVLLLSGKPQFSYIYGVALVGTTAVYTLLNLMSETGIDAYRTASVLGYCLLPMVGLGGIGMGVGIDHPLGYILSTLSIIWCTYSASSIFVSILHMSHQRLLVAYPVGLLYGCFAILSMFSVRK